MSEPRQPSRKSQEIQQRSTSQRKSQEKKIQQRPITLDTVREFIRAIESSYPEQIIFRRFDGSKYAEYKPVKELEFYSMEATENFFIGVAARNKFFNRYFFWTYRDEEFPMIYRFHYWGPVPRYNLRKREYSYKSPYSTGWIMCSPTGEIHVLSIEINPEPDIHITNQLCKFVTTVKDAKELADHVQSLPRQKYFPSLAQRALKILLQKEPRIADFPETVAYLRYPSRINMDNLITRIITEHA